MRTGEDQPETRTVFKVFLLISSVEIAAEKKVEDRVDVLLQRRGKCGWDFHFFFFCNFKIQLGGGGNSPMFPGFKEAVQPLIS